MAPVDWEKEWGIMQEGIDHVKKIIQGDTNDSISCEEYMYLYTTSFNMCTFSRARLDDARWLYERYQQSMEEAIATELPSIHGNHGEFKLSDIVKRWSNHKIYAKWVARFFSYLDRFFITRYHLLNLREVGVTCFRDGVYEKVKGEVVHTILSLINREREGEQIDRSLLKNASDLFLDMGIDKMDYYENDFEAAILDDAASCYRRLASTWITEDSTPVYMVKVERFLDSEKGRISSYMHFSTEPKVLEKLIHELVNVHATQLLENEHSGCRELLRNGKVGDLSTMYKLFSKVDNGLEYVSKIFREHVIAEGMALVEQAEVETTKRGGDASQAYVPEVIELHEKCMTYMFSCFQNDPLFQKAFEAGFEVFCNKSITGRSIAELLSAFSDGILQKSRSEKLSDEDVEEILENIVKLLAYISDKDLFAEFCRKKLARRLLFDKSDNADHERSFLTKLKQQFGWQFTSKMEGMLTDLILARDHQTSFDDYIRVNPHANPRTGLAVSVLTTGVWPSYKPSDLYLPAEMVKCVEVFREFYHSKTKHRKLTWIHTLGSCTLTAKFGSKTMELIVTTYQAATLLLFNASDRLTYSEIMSQMNLTVDVVDRLLHSLSCAKYKILKKVPDTKYISARDYFEFNSEFTDKLRRIRVPLPLVEERRKVIEHVNNDRKYAIDACLVRIMKSRKLLDYSQLVSECVRQLSCIFKPDIKMIKGRIEDLISREFLARDKENPNLFNYVA